MSQYSDLIPKQDGDQPAPGAASFLPPKYSSPRAAIEPVALGPTGMNDQQLADTRALEARFGNLVPHQPSLTDQFRANLGHMLTGTSGTNPEADGLRRADELLKRTADTARMLSAGALAVTTSLIPLRIGTMAMNSVRVASAARTATEPLARETASAVTDGIVRATASTAKTITP